MIALIDADSLIYSSTHKRTPDEAVLYLTDRIEELCQRTKANEYALFLSIGSTFRHENTVGYKSKRSKERKEPVFYYIKEYLRSRGNFHIGVEADDLVTYWGNKIENSIICSPDKDVINTNKECFNYNKNVFFKKSENDILEFFWKQMLMGDSGDSITGIEGVGIKTAEKWLANGSFQSVVLGKYIEHYGFTQGIENFYKNYKQLYILRNKEDFIINGIEAPKQFKTVKIDGI
jgi:5'-3' exonuclease